MTHISIIGSGNMGQAISGLIAKSGNTVELVNSSDAGKPVTGDIVVLAVPTRTPRRSSQAWSAPPACARWTLAA